jgi:multiple sugar transport system ATP-binding protein
MHVNLNGKDAIVILPTIDLSTEQKTSFNYGAKINITFGGNVVHLFSKADEKSLLPLE